MAAAAPFSVPQMVAQPLIPPPPYLNIMNGKIFIGRTKLLGNRPDDRLESSVHAFRLVVAFEPALSDDVGV